MSERVWADLWDNTMIIIKKTKNDHRKIYHTERRIHILRVLWIN